MRAARKENGAHGIGHGQGLADIAATLDNLHQTFGEIRLCRQSAHRLGKGGGAFRRFPNNRIARNQGRNHLTKGNKPRRAIGGDDGHHAMRFVAHSAALNLRLALNPALRSAVGIGA